MINNKYDKQRKMVWNFINIKRSTQAPQVNVTEVKIYDK